MVEINQANCSLYIGKEAGKVLFKDLNQAKTSIKVVSPKLSPSLVKKLIEFNKRKISVELITADSIEDFFDIDNMNIHQLIIQNKEFNQDALQEKKIWQRKNHILLAIIICLLLCSGFFIYQYKNLTWLGMLLPVMILNFLYTNWQQKIRQISVYNYSYNQLFPFKVFLSPQSNPKSKTSIHSNIYIIDGEIAYLGSASFTEDSLKKNYESMVRSEDPEVIKQLEDEFNRLMQDNSMPVRDIYGWAKQLYFEPAY